MAQNAIDLCNKALQRVGATTIMSLLDNSPEARACNLVYDSNRRDELRKHVWNFAIKRAVLAPDVAAPLFDYTYAFTMPSDCIRVLRPPTVDLDWKIEGRKILTNDGSTLYLRYIADITDPAQWDPSFYNAAALALAVDISERLTQSNGKKNMLMAEYDQAIKIARRMDAYESGPDEPVEDGWLVARL